MAATVSSVKQENAARPRGGLSDTELLERPTLAPRQAAELDARRFLIRCGVPECGGVQRLLAALTEPQLRIACFIAAMAHEAGRTED